jgi:hypothetical protein
MDNIFYAKKEKKLIKLISKQNNNMKKLLGIMVIGLLLSGNV